MSKQTVGGKTSPNILCLISSEVCVPSEQQSPSEPKVDLNTGNYAIFFHTLFMVMKHSPLV